MTADPAVAQPSRRRSLRISPFGAAAIATATVVFVAALARQIGVPKIATMWAEDGTLFLSCAYHDAAAACLMQPYQGYVHMVPRIIALAASMVPPTEAPATISILAALVAAGAAAIACRSIADATSSPLAGLLGGVGLALVWQAGREILGNSANLHWVLFASTTVAVVTSWLGARIGLGTIGLAAVTGLTSALSPVIAVLSLGAVVARKPRAWTLFMVCASAALVQVAVELTSDRLPSSEQAVTLTAVAAYVRTEVVRLGFFGPVPMPAGLIVPVLIVVIVVGLGLTRRDRRVVGVVVAVGTLVALGLAICTLSIMLNRALNPRYAYLPTSLMVAALAIAGGFLARELGGGSGWARAGRVVMPMIVAIVGVGFALSFRLEARASTGPDVSAEIRAAATRCAPGASVTVLISPSPSSYLWTLAIPCSRLDRP